MPGWIETLFSSKSAAVLAMAVLLLAAAAIVLAILRPEFHPRIKSPRTGRSRQPRLGIVDVFDVDRQRQLVIVRRDNVEHLLMIGGPNDLVIESEITGAEAREPQPADIRLHEKELHDWLAREPGPWPPQRDWPLAQGQSQAASGAAGTPPRESQIEDLGESKPSGITPLASRPPLSPPQSGRERAPVNAAGQRPAGRRPFPPQGERLSKREEAAPPAARQGRAGAATPLRREPALRETANPAAAARAAADAASRLPPAEMPVAQAGPDLEILPSRQDQERPLAAGGPAGVSPPAGQETAPRAGTADAYPAPGEEGTLEEKMARLLGR